MRFPRFFRLPGGPALLGLACLLYLFPTGWRLGRSDSRYHMEQMSLLPAQETWLRMHGGEPDAWKNPSLHERPRIRKPPLMIWLNLAAWSDLDPETSTVNQRIGRARWVAAGLGLLGLVSTFGIGRLLYGAQAGGLAALALATMYSTIKQGRLATFDTHLMGWVPLAAFATLAVADRRARPLRWAWLPLAILASLAAMFTKGPVMLVALLPALLLAPLCFGGKRFHPVLLALPLLAAGAVYGLWVRHVLETVPDAERILVEELVQDREKAKPVFYYLIALAMVFPWTLPFLRDLPLLKSLGRERRYPILVFALVLVLLSFAEAKRQRYLMPAMPFAALALAVAWRERAAREEGKPVALDWIHAGWIAFVSLLLPIFLPLQTRMVAWGWLRAEDLPGAGVGAAILAMLLLWPLAAWLLRATRDRNRGAVLLATAIWLSTGYTFAMHFYVDSYHGQYEHQDEADRLNDAVAGAPLFLATRGDRPFVRPDDKFYFHAALRMPRRDLKDPSLRGFALVPESHLPAPSGWSEVLRIDEDRRFVLYRLP